MKIEDKEQTIVGLHANFELHQSVHVHTGTKNEHVHANFGKIHNITPT